MRTPIILILLLLQACGQSIPQSAPKTPESLAQIQALPLQAGDYLQYSGRVIWGTSSGSYSLQVSYANNYTNPVNGNTNILLNLDEQLHFPGEDNISKNRLIIRDHSSIHEIGYLENQQAYFYNGGAPLDLGVTLAPGSHKSGSYQVQTPCGMYCLGTATKVVDYQMDVITIEQLELANEVFRCYKVKVILTEMNAQGTFQQESIDWVHPAYGILKRELKESGSAVTKYYLYQLQAFNIAAISQQTQ